MLYSGGYQAIIASDGSIEHRYTIRAGGGIVASFSKAPSHPSGLANYLHKDALGSVDLITDDANGAPQYQGYTPFGSRRDMNTLQQMTSYGSLLLSGFTPVITKRGFTGHEHIDELDLIHMNGRVYDPGIGRFLSPDPTVQLPKSTQGFNRYAYVQNNPLKYVDPSGYSLRGLFKIAAVVAVAYITAGASMAASGVAAIEYVGVGGAMFGGFVGGFVSVTLAGGDANAALRGGLFGALSAGIAYGIGQAGITNKLIASYAHGLTQGMVSTLRGGRFKDGFLSAFAGHYIGESSRSWDALRGSVAGRTAVAAFSGGITTRLGGGKFENGAVTAAFVHLFNAEGNLTNDQKKQALMPGTLKAMIEKQEWLKNLDPAGQEYQKLFGSISGYEARQHYIAIMEKLDLGIRIIKAEDQLRIGAPHALDSFVETYFRVNKPTSLITSLADMISSNKNIIVINVSYQVDVMHSKVIWRDLSSDNYLGQYDY